MAGILNALNAGITGLLTQQKAIEVTGNNVANVNTPGYTRQTPELASLPSIRQGGPYFGQGVNVEDVTRDYHAFIENRIIEQQRTLGQEQAKAGPLSELERVFNVGDNSLASQIDLFFQAWHDLSANPSGEIERDVVMQRGEQLISAFDYMERDLNQISANIDDTLQSKLQSINLKLEEVAELNDRISQRESAGYTANESRDRRDILLKELSQTLGIRTYSGEGGKVSVQLPGGLPLVEGETALQLEGSMVNGSLELGLQLEDSTLEIKNKNLGGEFKGLVSIRDQLIPELQTELSKLKNNIVARVNAQHQMGSGLDGTSERAFFTQLTSFVLDTSFADYDQTTFDSGEINIDIGGSTKTVQIAQDSTLADIRDSINSSEAGVVATIRPDSGNYRLYLTPENQDEDITGLDITPDGGNLETGLGESFTEQPGSIDTEMTLDDTAQVAAGMSDKPGDNSNALSMVDLSEANIMDGQDTFGAYYGKLASRVGIESQRNQMAEGGAEDAMVQLENLRQAKSGVSLEEEMMNLTQFQKAFEASARFVSTVDEMMATVISMKR